MLKEVIQLKISDSIGNVSAQYLIPEEATSIMVLSHGAGADMHHSFMVSLAETLAIEHIATLRFNFPFMENKKGRPDLPAVAHKTVEAAIRRAETNYPTLPLFLGGKSFGGRMSSQYLSSHPQVMVKGMVFFGFPLHPARKPAIERAEHLKAVLQPMLFLQGTKDMLAEWKLIETVCRSLPAATLVKVEGADHSFKKGKENLVSALVHACKEWIDPLIG